MISKLQHLQLAKLHPFTRVANTKSATPNSEGLGHRALKAFAIYPSDRARVSRQSVTICLLFLFLFHFLFFFFLFWKTHWPPFHGVLNLFKVVNETRVGFAKLRRLGSSSAYC